MTKLEIIKQVVDYLPGEHEPREVAMYFDAILKVMGNALKEKKDIELRGFGTFAVNKQKERTIYLNGAYSVVDERYTVNFKAGKLIKEQLKKI